ncbi:MAG TPA: hypothetical protein VH595_23080 [Verrucomicrobiae bacterium]|jgi:hypothetical protein|nr:hypothetical protein [Verrucomicrobiae bacterium]
MAEPGTSPHQWRFFVAGGFDQVKLETGADLLNLDQLDQKLWVALACPVHALHFSPRTAELIDTDQDGRIRAPELIAAVKWAGAMLKDPDDLVRGGDSLSLDAIDDTTEEGQQIRDSARQVLINLGRPDATALSLADISDADKNFANALLNGDGVIVPESAVEDATRGIIKEIADCMGTVVDRSGNPGIDQDKADAFFAECEAYDAWTRAGQQDAATILPFGDQTAAAFGTVKTIRGKVDDYFGRCRLAAFDPRAAALVNRKEDDYLPITAKEIGINVPEVADFPLAQAAPGKPLPLAAGVNPAFAEAVTALRENAVKPILGNKTELAESDWLALQARLAPFEKWDAAKAGTAVEKLGLPRVRGILAGSGREKINALIAEDKEQDSVIAAVTNVEKLLRCVRDLYVLCVNFVNFKDLYAGDVPAIFQAGVLFLDQRSCHLCLTVEDTARHAAMAGMAGAYLAYLDCTRHGELGAEKMSIVAVFSQGDDDNLMVGRNGIFYDRQWRDYDATITKIVSNPVSLRQAFWTPYKKLVRLVEEHVVKRASAADASVGTQLSAVATVPAPTPAAATPSKTAFDPSVVALASVALGTLAAAFTTFLAFLGKFDAWQIPLLVIGVLLIISGPSIVLAYMKLRQRNLGPILDANGWAINARAKINVPFGAKLTDIAKLPPGSRVDGVDRYAQKSAIWPKILLFVFLVWWIYAILSATGVLYRLTKNWDIPLGKPPAAQGTNSTATATNNSSPTKK